MNKHCCDCNGCHHVHVYCFRHTKKRLLKAKKGIEALKGVFN